MWNKNQILVLRNILSPKDIQFLLFWSGVIRFLCNYICFEKVQRYILVLLSQNNSFKYCLKSVLLRRMI